MKDLADDIARVFTSVHCVQKGGQKVEITIKIEAPELAKSINKLATALGGMINISLTKEEFIREYATPEETPEETTEETTEQVSEPVQGPFTGNPMTKEHTITLEELRMVMSRKAKEGKKNEVKEILAKYGAKTLPELDKKHYEAVYKEVKTLG